MMNRHGLMTFDALAGLFLLAAIATALAVSANLRQKSAVQLTHQRQANAAAQEALGNLQTTGKPQISDSSIEVSVEYTGQRVGKSEWVEVSTACEGRHASIVGLAPTTQPGVSP